METAGPSFNGPSGTAVNTAKCSQSSVGCLQKASQVCGGQYLVLDSESHSGGRAASLSGRSTAKSESEYLPSVTLNEYRCMLSLLPLPNHG